MIESGTDVRLVEGLASRCTLTVLARAIPGGVAISRPTDAARFALGPASRAGFAAFALGRLMRAGGRFDRVLVQGYGAAALAAAVAGRLTSVPHAMLVCSPVESYYRCRLVNPSPRQPYSALAYRGLVALAALNAQIGAPYIVLGDYLAQWVRGHGARGPVHVVPVYGVDVEHFRPADRPKPAIRAQLGLPASGALLFHSSRVAPEKDTPTVLAALAMLRAAGRDVWLLHRSGGWAEVAALAGAMGVAERVIATDAVHPVRELPLSYQASDVVIQASLDEGLGFSVLEAMACGTPVVASAVGGLRETVRGGVTGWSVPPRDSAALAAAIAAALDDPDEARRRAETARAMVLERYTDRAAFDRLFQVLAAA